MFFNGWKIAGIMWEVREKKSHNFVINYTILLRIFLYWFNKFYCILKCLIYQSFYFR